MTATAFIAITSPNTTRRRSVSRRRRASICRRWAQRTSRLRFGPLVYLLPFYHPLRLIEEICFLDQVSRGRMQIGIGRGVSPFEQKYYGIDPETSRQRFEEILEILLKGLTGKTLSHAGPSYQFSDVPMETAPYQKPHPPLWMGVNTADSAAVAARRGANIVSLVSASAMRPVVDGFWKAAGTADKTTRKTGLSYFIVHRARRPGREGRGGTGIWRLAQELQLSLRSAWTRADARGAAGNFCKG